MLEPLKPPHLRHRKDYEILERRWTPPGESVVLRISPPALERQRAWRGEGGGAGSPRAGPGLVRLYLYPGYRAASWRREVKRLVRRWWAS